MQKEEYLIKNACYSVTKYYLCKQNNKRSLLGRKQRSQVARSFPNRYQFSCTNKVTSLFSISCILRIILTCKTYALIWQNNRFCNTQAEIFYQTIQYLPLTNTTTNVKRTVIPRKKRLFCLSLAIPCKYSNFATVIRMITKGCLFVWTC